jgi:SagB-type dehydrogenase family enzyme
MSTSQDQIQAVYNYHARTKHHFHRFAPSLGYLDWDMQPDPFRTFDGAPTIDLPLAAERLSTVGYGKLFSSTGIPLLQVTQDSIGAFFELALGLSAWKQYDKTRWSLRCNPSSGNLHPTEGYAILPELEGLSAGVYHYLSRDHQFERRCSLEQNGAQQLRDILSPGFLIGLSSIHWREAWKYGERAFRYCQHDMGHAIAAMRFAAAALGWKAKLLGVSDSCVTDVLGLGRDEDFAHVEEGDREQAGALITVGPEDPFIERQETTRDAIESVRRILGSGRWAGRANVLSPSHVSWPAIDVAAKATWKGDHSCSPKHRTSAPEFTVPGEDRDQSDKTENPSAVRIIKQRRSAVALDGTTSVPVETFYRMLHRLQPRSNAAPWDVLPWPPYLHCGIFVHRVDGLSPGLYLFIRNLDSLERLKSALDPLFLFEHPQGCPDYLPLVRLASGDFRERAAVLSCQQKIASAGAFSLGMIADFRDSVRCIGPWWYRRLFWEAGVLGQMLYLEAEAAGVRGTGIGCYFDDAFHSILGLRDDQFQSLYHFTIGGPVEDKRLITLPAYAHLSHRAH